MPSYPPGVTTATIRVGTFVDFFGDAAAVTAKVRPVLGNDVTHIVHAPTGTAMVPASRTFESDITSGVAEFDLPHTDSPDWVDPSGKSVSLWKYVVEVKATLNKGFGRSLSWSKEVQPLIGQTEIDLDLVPSNEISGPVYAEPAAVLSVNGQTGSVILPLITQETVNDSVASALASDETVSAAAAQAVTGEMTKAGIFYGAKDIPESVDLAISFTDVNDRRTWIEADRAGRPSAHSRDILAEDLAPTLSGAIAEEIGITELGNEYGWSAVFTDTDNRIMGGFRHDGRFIAHDFGIPAGSVTSDALAPELVDSLATVGANPFTVSHSAGFVSVAPRAGAWELRNEDAVSGASTLLYSGASVSDVSISGGTVYFTAPETPGESSTGLAVPLTGGAVSRVMPIVSLAAFGDSMTHGMGGGYGVYAWPHVAATALGIPYANHGLSAQTSTEIAVRQGGIAPTFTVTGGVIPASGSVVLTEHDPVNNWRLNSAWEWPGTLNDVLGTLTKATDNTFSFVRASAGDAVPATGRAVFRSTIGRETAHWIQTFWVGRNNTNIDTITRDVFAMAAHARTLQKRYLVFPVFNSSSEASGGSGYNNIMAINAALAEAYGARYVDTRRWIIDNGLAAAGLTPTDADNTAIAQDRIPPALMADSLHLNATGYRVLGEHIAAVIRQKGWA